MIRAMMRTLDRRQHFDEKSRDYPIRALFTPQPAVRRKRIWTPLSTPLDQGQEGECVAFSWLSELAATPWRHPADNAAARALFQRIRACDRAMGNHWEQGASILAGAKVCRAEGAIREYRWCFGIDDVIETILRRGPVILGVEWYESMYDTDPGGLVRIGGPKAGEHAIMANGFWPDHPRFGDVAVWTNTWGPGYGLNGMGLIPVGKLDWLLQRGGEGCSPIDARPRAA